MRQPSVGEATQEDRKRPCRAAINMYVSIRGLSAWASHSLQVLNYSQLRTSRTNIIWDISGACFARQLELLLLSCSASLMAVRH